jgi:hypothetical protein
LAREHRICAMLAGAARADRFIATTVNRSRALVIKRL